MARSLEDVAVRRYVKEQSLLNIDGENDMLYELMKLEQVGNQTFSSHLVANLPKQNIPVGARRNATAFFNEQFEKIPLLSVGVAVHLDEWDAEKYVPLVAVELSDHSEQAPYIRAYDSEGEVHLLPLEEAPDVPTVVVRMNERIESLGTVAGKLMYRASDFVPKTKEFHHALRRFDNHILSRVDYGKVTNAISARLCGPGEEPPGCDENPGPRDPSPPPTPTCRSRDCKSGKDKIGTIEFYSTTNFKQLEERWTDRWLELYVLVFAENIPLNPLRIEFGDSNSQLHYNYLQDCPLIGSCDTRPYLANESLQFQWNEATHGQYVGFRWMEYDGGGTTTISYSYKPCDACASVSISFSQKNEDDRLGDILVELSLLSKDTIYYWDATQTRLHQLPVEYSDQLHLYGIG